MILQVTHPMFPWGCLDPPLTEAAADGRLERALKRATQEIAWSVWDVWM